MQQEESYFFAIAFCKFSCLRFYANQAFFRRSDLTTQNKYNQRDESSLLAANIQLGVLAAAQRTLSGTSTPPK